MNEDIEIRHFLDLCQIDTHALRKILDLGNHYRESREKGSTEKVLQDKSLAMVFEKNSTRTRMSFEVGMKELGGYTVVMNSADTQLGRGESIPDTARVMSRYVDAIMLRTTAHSRLKEFAEYSSVPVINALTDDSHPCQIMADIMTYEQHRGGIRGRKIAWIGDGNNVATSFIHASAKFDFEICLACPQEYFPNEEAVEWAIDNGANVTFDTDPLVAAADADCIVTDTWTSMGQENPEHKKSILRPYQVNSQIMGAAKPDAVFMHCLPAHRGEEVTDTVMDSSQSLVWDEAENRLHVQKAILQWCINGF